MFFQMRAAVRDGAPQARRVERPLRNWKCPGCGVLLSEATGPATSCEIAAGGFWPDALDVEYARPPLFVSERVVTDLERIKATGFTPGRVQWAVSRGDSPRKLDQPDYYDLDIAGTIDRDENASGIAGLARCGSCSRQLTERLVRPRRYAPVAESWDGSDLFRVRTWAKGGSIFCTLRVLELARERRWTNFRFDAMDVVRDHAEAFGAMRSGYRGVDYLAEQWPPPAWYPEPPSAGRTADEWIAELWSDDYSRWFQARIALFDLGAECVAKLAESLEQEPETRQRVIAGILAYIHKNRSPLPESLVSGIELFLNDEDRKTLRQGDSTE